MKVTIRESDNTRKPPISISIAKTHKGIYEPCDGKTMRKLSSSVNLIKLDSTIDEKDFMITIVSMFETDCYSQPKIKIAQCDLSKNELTEIRNQINYILNYKQ